MNCEGFNLSGNLVKLKIGCPYENGYFVENTHQHPGTSVNHPGNYHQTIAISGSKIYQIIKVQK